MKMECWKIYKAGILLNGPGQMIGSGKRSQFFLQICYI